jgi:hypothetical protein
VFNLSDTAPKEIRVDWLTLKLPDSCTVRDLWEHADLGSVKTGHTFTVPPHGSGLYKITPVQ